MGTSQRTSCSSRLNISCAMTVMNMYRSPEGPFLSPYSPSPDKRSLEPVSTPAGIFTVRGVVLLVLPAPMHSAHGSFITEPAPWQEGQVLATLKNPCWNLTCPAPRQVEQATGVVPGFAPEPPQVLHATVLGTLTVFSVPKADSSNVISRSNRRSAPLSGPGRLLRQSPRLSRHQTCHSAPSSAGL